MAETWRRALRLRIGVKRIEQSALVAVDVIAMNLPRDLFRQRARRHSAERAECARACRHDQLVKSTLSQSSR